jgi:hypothetical protein
MRKTFTKIEQTKFNVMAEICRRKYGIEPGDIGIEERLHYWDPGMTAEEAVDELARKYDLVAIS